MVSINVPPPQLWGGQHTEMFVNHVTVFSQSVTRIKLSHTILCNSQCKRSEPYGNGALNACCMYSPTSVIRPHRDRRISG